MKIEPAEALRYLGYRGSDADPKIRELVGSCSLELTAAASPRAQSQAFDLAFSDGGTVIFPGFSVQSKNLFAHLTGCRRALLFAATLGPAPDTLLRRYEKTNIARAAVLQACAAALIESYCDEEQELLSTEAETNGLFLLPRYSPGYGDFSLTHQGDILRTLDSTKKIGLGLTDSFMLVPTKSVTAVIGLTAEKIRRTSGGCSPEGCETCGALNCQFRRST